MIPLRAENLRRGFATINILLIALNVIVFVYQLSLPEATQQAMVTTLGVVPGRVESAIAHPGGNLLMAVVPLVSSMFLHGGWLHLLGNMLFLWVFGGSVEERLGHFGYLLFYLFCGIASGMVQIIANWGSGIPSIGASGAISGVMGAYIIYYPRSRILTLVPLLFFFFTVRLPAMLMVGYWFLIQVLSGMSTLGQIDQGGVAWWAHIGGFVVGMLAALLVRVDSAFSRRTSW